MITLLLIAIASCLVPCVAAGFVIWLAHRELQTACQALKQFKWDIDICRRPPEDSTGNNSELPSN